MALPSSGYLLLGADGGASGRSINSEFGYGNDFASYRGAYAGKNGLAYQFPVIGNSFPINSFYSTSKITSGSQSSVVSIFTGRISGNTLTVSSVAYGSLAVGSIISGTSVLSGTYIVSLGTGSGGTGTYTVNYPQTLSARSMSSYSSYFTVPVYNTITITVQGDQGGQAGDYGVYGCKTPTYPTASEGGKSSGVVTTFGGYVSYGSGSGGSGNGGSGSYGSTYQTFTNPAQGGSGPLSGSIVTVTVGPGGEGGKGGANWAVYYHYLTNDTYCDVLNYADSGDQGAPGLVTISWS